MSIPELTRRGDRYYFIRRVPTSLVPLFGMRFVRKSLQTSSLTEAKIRLKTISIATERLFTLAGSGMFTDDEIGRLFAQYKDKILAGYEKHRNARSDITKAGLSGEVKSLTQYSSDILDILTLFNRPELETIDRQIERYQSWVQRYKQQMKRGEFDEYIYSETMRFIRENGLEVETPPPGFFDPNNLAEYHEDPPAEFYKLCRKMAQAQVEILSIEAARLDGDYENSYDREIRKKQERPGTRLFSEAFDSYIKAAEVKGRKPKTVMDLRTQKKMFLDIMADKQIGSYEFDELLPLKQRLEEKGLGLSRVHHYLTAFNSFFNWCVKRRWLQYSPCPTWEKSKELKQNIGYIPWSNAELEKLLKTTYFTEPRHRIKSPHNFWVPLIGILSGMRLTEICQLYLEDICQCAETGILFFDVNDNAPDKALKRDSTARNVPLHSLLLDLGILDLKGKMEREGHQRLFPGLKYNRVNGYGHNFSGHFSKFTKRNKIFDDPQKNKVFHGLRKNFASNLQLQGVSQEQIAFLLGHKQALPITEHYTGPLALKLKKEVIEKLDYRLDLSGLCRTSY